MIRIIFLIIINIAVLAFLGIYSVKYSIFPYLLADLSHNKGKKDRIRRLQMRKKAEESPLPDILEKLSNSLRRLGFSFMIPGESPLFTALFTVLLSLDIVVALGLVTGLSLITRLIFGVIFIIIVPMFGIILLRKRTYEAEEQLASFGKMAEGAVSQYSTLSEIFANHYMEFKGSLMVAMEEYHIECLTHKDENLALAHFEEKFCSPLINVIMENLVIIKGDDRDLEKTCRMSIDIINNYVEKTSGNRDLLKEARLRLSGSLIIIIILFIAGSIYSGGINTLLTYGTDLSVYMDIANMESIGLYVLIMSMALYLTGIFQSKGF